MEQLIVSNMKTIWFTFSLAAALVAPALGQRPTFSTQPADVTAVIGPAIWGQIYFHAYASGVQPISYQWLKNEQPISKATTNVLEFTEIELGDAGNYQLVAANAGGAVTSRVARLTVVGLLLGAAPFDTTTPLGNPARLWVGAQSSVPVSYQWFFDGMPLAGARNSSLTFPAVNYSDSGKYFVIVSNRYGMATSVVASLTIALQAPTTPYIDVLVGSYSTLHDLARVSIGTRVKLQAVVQGGPPPALQWRRDGTDLPGQTNNFIFYESIPAAAAGEYSVVATNLYGAATSAPVRLEVTAQAPDITVLPSPVERTAGSIVPLQAYAAGGPAPEYQWRRNGADLPGETNRVLLLTNATVDDSGIYEIVARNSEGETRATNFVPIRPATGLDQWEWRLPCAQGSRLRSVAWGDGRYVAVGKAGNIITSTNGVDWTSVVVEIDGGLDKVVFGNGLFVAVGTTFSPYQVLSNYNVYSYLSWDIGLVFTSADGLNWSAAPATETIPIASLTFGNGVFVACASGSKAFVHTSTDGRHWTPQVLDGLNARLVSWQNGSFLAMKNWDLYRSTDAVHWEHLPNSLYSGYVMALCFGLNRYVAAGYQFVFVSDDGVDWRDQLLARSTIKSVAASPTRFVALTDNIGKVLVSEDGENWAEVDTYTDQELEAVIYANGRFLAVGEAGTITTSADGLRWTPDQVANRVDYYGVARLGSLLVVAGDAGNILTSTNGRDWTYRPTPTTRNLHAVHYANGLFVASGRKGALITSPDGVAWTSRASGVPNYLERIHWADGLWVAVGELGDITTSTNGLNWTPLNTGTAPLTDHEGVTYGNGLWVAAGGYFEYGGDYGPARSTLFTSTNGRDWTLNNSLRLGVRLRDVTFGGGRFLAVGNDGQMLLSTNGLEWATTWAYSPQGTENLRRVIYASGRFVAAGNDGILISSATPENPLSWIRHRSRTSQNLHDTLVAADGTFTALGNNGMILQSGPTQPSFAGVRSSPGGITLEIDPQLAEGQLSVEATDNFQSWQTIATPVGRSVEIPVGAQPFRFFRLVAP